MSAFVSNGKLYLNGAVGDGILFEYFTYEDVMMALDDVNRDKKLTVHVNSPGGIATEGAAIYAALLALPHGVDIVIEGIAASAGSIIAMAGKTITMTNSSVMMIHDVSNFTIGNADDHRRSITELDALSNVYAGVYAAKSKKTVAACRDLMRAETWFEPQQAVAAGFADKVSGPGPRGMMAAAFDYSLFQHAPKKLLDLAAAKNWKVDPTPPIPSEDKTMSNTPAATARAEAAARIKTILTHAEAKDRSDLAEHLALETDIEPEAAVALLAKAGKTTNPTSQAKSYQDQRLAAAANARRDVSSLGALAMPNDGREVRMQASGLVANMKRRNGIK